MTAGIVSTTGNVFTGNIFNSGIISSTGNSTAANYLTAGIVSATGNITGGNLTVSTGTITVGNIVNSNANGVGNIGSSGVYFNTIFAKATSAQYADLAEKYISDAEYTPGTVVIFGGNNEITITDVMADVAVAGVISTEPAFLMNTGTTGLPVALRGRVPVKIIGPVAKGDLLVSSTTPGYACSVGKDASYGIAVFAKSLETDDNSSERVIEAVII